MSQLRAKPRPDAERPATPRAATPPAATPRAATLRVDPPIELAPIDTAVANGVNGSPTDGTRASVVESNGPTTPGTTHSTDPLEASRLLDDDAPDGGWRAWGIVLACTLLGFWFVGTTYSWGVLQGALVEQQLAPPSTLAFVGSISVSLLSIFAMANSRLFTQFGARKMAIVGTLFMAASQIAASFCTRSIPGLFLTAGVMMGLGVSLCFMVISITPAQYFTTKRGTALGIVYAGGGFGGAIISLALESGIRNLGVPWTFRLIGIIMLATCLPAAWYIEERIRVNRRQLVDWSLFKTLDFNILFLAGALGTFPLFVPPFFLPLYAHSMHLSATTGAVLVCIFNFSSAIGRIMTGFMSDRLTGPLNTLFIVLSVTAISLLVLWPSSVKLAPLIIFVLVNGASSGGFFAIMPTVVNNIMGTQRYATAFGMIVTGWAGGYMMGAPIAGYLLAAYGGEGKGIAAYRPAVFWAGGMAFGAAALAGWLRWRKSPYLMIKM